MVSRKEKLVRAYLLASDIERVSLLYKLEDKLVA